ncbi:MAG: hypothetical protein KF855_14810 [Acidobacteria bacterium]|nr:hypothetical protein [Acidobacteriota bacterium]
MSDETNNEAEGIAKPTITIAEREGEGGASAASPTITIAEREGDNSSSAAASPTITIAEREGDTSSSAAASPTITIAEREGDGDAAAPATEAAESEDVHYQAVEKDGTVTAIWEMQGQRHLRTIDPRSGEGKQILALFETAA